MSYGLRWNCLGVCVALLALSAFCPQSHAQGRQGPAQQGQPSAGITWGGYGGSREKPHRTIVGTVYDANDKLDTNAMVYLKNMRDSSILTLKVDERGTYRFGPLSLSDDYELWAVDGKKKTVVKPLSSFIQTNLVTVPLRFTEESAAAATPVSAPAK
ncbi:MAG: hypothetical protein PW792_06520 [Acidobacteriaceae bacterium]|nr:hypothetical protein [Acidobacteriaceae bacterium]